MTGFTPAGAYLYFDGDDVGAGIELRLLEGDLVGAADLSARVSEAIVALASTLRLEFAAEIIFAAGDEVLAHTLESLETGTVERLRDLFKSRAGLTISCGVADTPDGATVNLHLAKLRGKNRVEVVPVG
ncbi:mCpol domain-containing protein [Microbacterium sp. P07]|uniref:mCpol domain-containing protein n=1 Tax=Microbacterium sp. P07 TaxID=3366952 RepID=UPI0037454002